MILRRLPMLVLTLALLVALVLTARDTVPTTQAVFSNVAAPWMPSAPLPGGLTSTWFCPGVPAAGENGAAGTVTVFNVGDAAMGGRITVLGVEGDSVTEPVDVAAFGQQVFDLDALVDSRYASAFVEIDGGGGLVEQKATTSEGESIAACANGTSREWYFATADTLDDSTSLLVLSNPNDDFATVDIVATTSAGFRDPQALQNFPVPARSVRIVDLKEEIKADEVAMGVQVVATRGDVVAGRAQTYGTETRRGYVMSLGAPARRDQWWFAHGREADNVSVEYQIYNPNDHDVEVTPLVLGFPQTAEFQLPDSVVVPDGEVATFALDDLAGIPEGLVTMLFATTEFDDAIVVERIITETITGRPTTGTTMGATFRPTDGYVANTWFVGLRADGANDNGLTVYNYDAVDAVVTVQAITDDGLVTVPSLEAVDVPASFAASIDLTDPAVLNRPLIIRSTTRIFVERVLPREQGAEGQVAVWAVPSNS